MATFPTLSSGAVTQYPVPHNTGQAVGVIRFLDGTDQRYLTRGKTLRQWQIRMNLLNDSEIQQIEAFFDEQQGDYSPFVFPDPISGAAIPNCRFGASGLLTEYVGVGSSSTSFWIIETNG